MNLMESIRDALVDMDKEKVVELTRKALSERIKPETILDEALTPAMEIVGQEYENGNIFITEMLLSAEAMKGSMELLRPILAKPESAKQGKVIIGAVQGDIHSLGAEIVCSMLEGSGFEVYNLGIDVPAQKFVEVAINQKADIIGLSAFLTTTGLRFADVIQALQEAGIREQVKVMIGGAIASQNYADVVGADGYGANGAAAVRLAKSLMVKR